MYTRRTANLPRSIHHTCIAREPLHPVACQAPLPTDFGSSPSKQAAYQAPIQWFQPPLLREQLSDLLRGDPSQKTPRTACIPSRIAAKPLPKPRWQLLSLPCPAISPSAWSTRPPVKKDPGSLPAPSSNCHHQRPPSRFILPKQPTPLLLSRSPVHPSFRRQHTYYACPPGTS